MWKFRYENTYLKKFEEIFSIFSETLNLHSICFLFIAQYVKTIQIFWFNSMSMFSESHWSIQKCDNRRHLGLLVHLSANSLSHSVEWEECGRKWFWLETSVYIDKSKGNYIGEKYSISVWFQRIDITCNILVASNYSYLFENVGKLRTPFVAENVERHFSSLCREKFVPVP